MSVTEKKKNGFLVQGSILAASAIIVRIIGIIYRVPVTNIIGEEGNGYYSNAFEIYNIVLILSSFSLPLSVSKLVAARNVNKEYRNSYKIFIGSMIFALVSGTIATLVLYFGADFFASVIFKYPRSAIPMRVLAPTILVSAVMGVLRGYFQGKKTMMPTAISQILEQIVNAIVSISAAYLLMKQHSASKDIAAYGAAGSTLGTFAGAVAALVLLLFIYSIYRPTIRRQIRRDQTQKRESYKQIFIILFITIMPVILSQTVYNISGLIDNALFGQIMSDKGFSEEVRSSMVGVYSGKYRLLTNVPIAVASAVAASLVPSIVMALAKNDKESVKGKIKAAIHFNMIIAFPSAVGMTVLAEPMIQMLFPGSGPLAGNLLRMGSVAIIFFVLSTVSNGILQGLNLMKLPVIHSAISLAVHTVVVFVLLKFFDLGVYGLVIGNITFALLIAVMNWIAIGKNLKYSQEIKKTFIMPAISAGVMGIFAWLIYKGMYLLSKSNGISTLIAIFTGIIIYGIALLLLKGVDENELYGFPLGRTLISIAKKLHLL